MLAIFCSTAAALIGKELLLSALLCQYNSHRGYLKIMRLDQHITNFVTPYSRQQVQIFYQFYA